MTRMARPGSGRDNSVDHHGTGSWADTPCLANPGHSSQLAAGVNKFEFYQHQSCELGEGRGKLWNKCCV